MEMNQFNALIILLGYLIGLLPTGFLAGKWLAQIDLREIGSGSTGATNVLRHIGKGPALAVFIIDVSKGFLPVAIANYFNLEVSWQIVGGLSAVTGHIWPIWLKGRGGKAVATGLGVFLGLSWQVGLSCLGIFLSVLTLTRIVSLSSVIASLSLPIMMYLNFRSDKSLNEYLVVSCLTMLLVIWRHRSNLIRLYKGVEPKISQSK